MRKKILKSLLLVVAFSCWSLSPAFAYGTTRTSTSEETVYDNSLYWVKGYVTIDYNQHSGRITNTTARSALLGLTYGHTWRPETPRVTVIDSIRRQVIFTGVITTNITVNGIGEVLAENVSHTMHVQSIPTLEGACTTCRTEPT